MSQPSQVEAIFLGAVEKETEAERVAYLESTCAGDVELRRQVEEKLNEHYGMIKSPTTPVPAQVGDDPADFGAQPELEVLAYLQPATKPGALGRLGHYEVFEVLGKGGFGTVLRAFDDKLQRAVAIKFMSTALAATSPARKRFLREARAAAAVRHENVVQIYAVEEQPIPYLVMEFIPGETLEQKLARMGPIDVVDVVRLGQQIARGLAAAHAKGLIHRDVKPGNILLEKTIDEQVKITDFGLARAADDASLTQSGVISGTPMYMAPEQAEGLALDARADLFSLGSVMYEMVSGRPPFRANTTVAALKRVCEDTPRPIREIIPETPGWLCDIIAKLHAKRPEDRLQSAKEVAEVLGNHLADLRPHSASRTLPVASDLAPVQPAAGGAETQKLSSETSMPARVPWLLMAGGAIAVILALVLAVVLFRPPADALVQIDCADPTVQVVFDHEEPNAAGAPEGPIRMSAGEHSVLVKRGDIAFETEKLTLNKSETVTLLIEVLQTKIQVSANGRVIGTRDLPVVEPKKAPPKTLAELPLVAPFPKEFVNRLDMKFTIVPRGKGWLGGGEGKVGESEFDIPHDFYLGVYEVTQEEWLRLMDFNPSRFRRDGDGKDEIAEIPDEDLKRFPVDSVSWEDAQEFVKRLNKKIQEKGWVYRLPTTNEWEYACRGGPLPKKEDYGFDFYLDRPMNTLPANKANFEGSGLKRTEKVGAYPPNRLGLHDMHGNVFELSDDQFVEDGNPLRHLLGGGWHDRVDFCRARNRNSGSPTGRYNGSGFRVALVRVVDAKAGE